MRFLIALLFVGFLIVNVQSETPGFKTVVSQNGLNYLKDVGVELLKKAIAKLDIPDINGESKTPLGKVKFDLKNIVLTGFGIGSSSITTIPGQGLQLHLKDAKCDVSLGWHYKRKHWPHVSDHGTGKCDVSSVSADVKIQITESNGRPHVAVISDSVSIGHLKIKLHGGASWLYNLFIKLFNKKIKSAIEKALTNAITKEVNNGLNIALSTLPVSVPINSQVNINYAFTKNPTFASSYLTASANGEFQAGSATCPAQTCPRTNTPDSITQQMIQMIITDFVADTAGYAFFKLGKLEAKVQDKNLPSWSPIRLNTTDFQYIIPALYKKYPNMKMMLRAYCSESPKAVFSKQGATVKAIGNLEVDVLDSKDKVIPVFTLNGFINTNGIAILKGLNIAGNLTYINGNFSLKSSEIGPFDPSVLNKYLNIFFSKGIIPAVNIFLSEGFPLPTVKGLTFKSPAIGWGDHFLYVSTDVTYVPPQSPMMKLSPPQVEEDW